MSTVNFVDRMQDKGTSRNVEARQGLATRKMNERPVEQAEIKSMSANKADTATIVSAIISGVVAITYTTISIINSLGCEGCERIPSGCNPLGDIVKKSGPFCFSYGWGDPPNTTAYIKKDEIYLETEDFDGGLYMELKKQISGTMSFTYSGAASKEVTIQFINKETHVEQGMYVTTSTVLDHQNIMPENESKSVSMQIPEGTNKIVVMKIGDGHANISIKSIYLENCGE